MYAIGLIVALTSFTIVALAAVDRAQRHDLDDQLETTANAVAVVGDMTPHGIVVDEKDRQQFRTIVGARAQCAMIAADGTIAVSTDDRTAHVLLRAVPATLPAHFDAFDGHEALRVYAEPVLDEGHRIATTLAWGDPDEIENLNRRLLIAVVIAIPLIVAIAVLGGGIIARRGLAPLDRIARLASEIEASDLSRRLALPERDDELGRLTATFDRMLARLQDAFERERRFTSDASHELRAPLAVIRAEADLALRRERSSGEYRSALASIAHEADALETLTRHLLSLARAEQPRDTAERAPTDLAVIAETAAERLDVLARARNITIQKRLNGPALVAADPVELGVVAMSIVHNAVKYGAEGSAIEIEVTRSDQIVELRVLDTGPGFSERGLTHAFDRFWRDDEARGRDGTGLGLSIAQRIVVAAGGSISARNRPEGGAELRVLLPSFFEP